MSKTATILPKTTTKAARKIIVSLSKSELHQAVSDVLKTRTLGRAFGEITLQCLWTIRTQTKTNQIQLARMLGSCLDLWIEQQNRGVTC